MVGDDKDRGRVSSYDGREVLSYEDALERAQEFRTEHRATLDEWEASKAARATKRRAAKRLASGHAPELIGPPNPFKPHRR